MLAPQVDRVLGLSGCGGVSLFAVTSSPFSVAVAAVPEHRVTQGGLLDYQNQIDHVSSAAE